MPTARASWGGGLASKTHDFAGTPVNPPEKSPPVRTPCAPGAPALAAAARLLGAERATGLANAVLRRFVAERGALLGRVDTELPPRTAHPAWIVERIAAAWPQACPAILAANNGHPPMTLRLDLSRTDRT